MLFKSNEPIKWSKWFVSTVIYSKNRDSIYRKRESSEIKWIQPKNQTKHQNKDNSGEWLFLIGISLLKNKGDQPKRIEKNQFLI